MGPNYFLMGPNYHVTDRMLNRLLNLFPKELAKTSDTVLRLDFIKSSSDYGPVYTTNVSVIAEGVLNG